MADVSDRQLLNGCLVNVINAGKSERGYHRIGVASVCLRQYAFMYADGPDGGHAPPSDSAPLVRGSLLHLGLAHHYAHQSIAKHGFALVNGQRVEDSSELLHPVEAIEKMAEDNGPSWTGHVPSITDCLIAYGKRWGNDDAWEIVGIEHEYRMRLPGIPKERNLYTQRADLVVRDKHSRKVWIIDHKTAYMIASKTARQYVLHGQFLGYDAIGRKEYGTDFGGVLLNRIRISPCEFDRRPNEPAPASARNFVQNLVHVENLVHQYNGLPAHQWPGTLHETVCVSKYGECPFFARCQWGKP
jgi:hypothetical protein